MFCTLSLEGDRNQVYQAKIVNYFLVFLPSFFLSVFRMRKMKFFFLHFFEFYSYLQRTPVLPNLITFDSSSNNLDNPVKNVLYRREDSVNVWRWVDALHQV